jgi:hypothetical protein
VELRARDHNGLAVFTRDRQGSIQGNTIRLNHGNDSDVTTKREAASGWTHLKALGGPNFRNLFLNILYSKGGKKKMGRL